MSNMFLKHLEQERRRLELEQALARRVDRDEVATIKPLRRIIDDQLARLDPRAFASPADSARALSAGFHL